jgi:hypothetical protein
MHMGREEYTINEKINLNKLDWLIKVEKYGISEAFL